MPPSQIYGFAELSKITGMSTSTLSTLLHRSRHNRSEGRVHPNDIPEPDMYFGLSPAWHRDTVRAWLVSRASGTDAGRVKKAVDPDKSLNAGYAVPLESMVQTTIEQNLEITPAKQHLVPEQTLRARVSELMNRVRSLTRPHDRRNT